MLASIDSALDRSTNDTKSRTIDKQIVVDGLSHHVRFENESNGSSDS
jgi:hypothetical protein